MTILPVYYLPPVAWWSAAAAESHVMLDAGIHYRKQTFASRAVVLAANRLLPLTIPVERRDTLQTPLCAKRISYAQDWQKQHWQSLVAAYHKSPYFEHYAPKLAPYFAEKPALLTDFTLALIREIATQISLETAFSVSETYVAASPTDTDLRGAFTPENAAANYPCKPYTQVFGNEFVPNLSILDMLFCVGNRSLGYL